MPMIPGPKEQSVVPDGQFAYQSSAGATPDAFGQSLGQGLMQAGDQSFQMAMRQAGIKNEADNNAAVNDFMQRSIDLQNGNKDKGIVGYRTLIGQNAVDALPDYQQKLEDARQEIRGSLNPAAQRMFDAQSFRIARGTADSMGNYSSQQQVVGAHQEARNGVKVSQQAALTFADDPGGLDAHLADVQEKSLAGSRILGLGPDATEEQRRQDVGEVFVNRVKDLAVRDPIQAANFYYGTPGTPESPGQPSHVADVPAEQRYEVERMLKTATSTQYARGDGTTAYHTAIGQASTPSMPNNVGAPDVKPYAQKDIDRVTSFVNSPYKYDAAIQDAAKTYGVSPSEIKLKIGVESGGNPQAVNPQGGHGDHATGLGQFTADTAARYGVTDRTDPVQSINGIAKMLAANGGTVGSNMAGSDRAYFGGNVNAKGPNTDQYVENTRAVRQALGGGSGAPAPLSAADLEGREGAVITAARAQAQARRPDDAQYSDQVVAEAHSKLMMGVQALKGQNYANFTNVLDAVNQTHAQTESDLPAAALQTYSKLDPEHQLAIQAQFNHQAAAARGEFTRSDPKLVTSLYQRIYAPDGDPQKITQPGQLSAYMGKGLNYTDQQRLIKEIKDANDPEGSPFLKQVASANKTAHAMLTGSLNPTAVAHPEIADEGSYRFQVALQKQIDAYRSAKKDPQSLLTPGAPDYVLSPNNVMKFLLPEAQANAAKAQAMKPTTAAPAKVQPRLPGETPAAYMSRVGMS